MMGLKDSGEISGEKMPSREGCTRLLLESLLVDLLEESIIVKRRFVNTYLSLPPFRCLPVLEYGEDSFPNCSLM